MNNRKIIKSSTLPSGREHGKLVWWTRWQLSPITGSVIILYSAQCPIIQLVTLLFGSLSYYSARYPIIQSNALLFSSLPYYSEQCHNIQLHTLLFSSLSYLAHYINIHVIAILFSSLPYYLTFLFVFSRWSDAVQYELGECQPTIFIVNNFFAFSEALAHFQTSWPTIFSMCMFS